MTPVRLSILLLSVLVLPQAAVWGVERPQSDKENAALSYWQAFAMIPEASDENDKILREWDTIELDDKALQVIEQHRDPAGDGPFQLRETPGGFELRSQLIHQEKPVTLQIGAGEQVRT